MPYRGPRVPGRRVERVTGDLSRINLDFEPNHAPVRPSPDQTGFATPYLPTDCCTIEAYVANLLRRGATWLTNLRRSVTLGARSRSA